MSRTPPDHGTQDGSADSALPPEPEPPSELVRRLPDSALLEVIDEFRTASLELIAWEFSLPPSALRAQWERFVEQQLIVPVGVDPPTGETMHGLTARGAALVEAARGDEHEGHG